jgi:hypothetical protein
MSHNKTSTDVPAGGAKRRFPLYLTLAAVFVTLFVVFGLALIGFFHLQGAYIDAALEQAVEDYSSMEAFIREGLGITDEEVALPREGLLD